MLPPIFTWCFYYTSIAAERKKLNGWNLFREIIKIPQLDCDTMQMLGSVTNPFLWYYFKMFERGKDVCKILGIGILAAIAVGWLWFSIRSQMFAKRTRIILHVHFHKLSRIAKTIQHNKHIFSWVVAQNQIHTYVRTYVRMNRTYSVSYINLPNFQLQ